MSQAMLVKWRCEQDQISTSFTQQLSAWLLGFHFLIAPFEMIFANEFGTISRYLGLIIITALSMEILHTKQLRVNKAIIFLASWIVLAFASRLWTASETGWHEHFFIYLRHGVFLAMIGHIRLKSDQLNVLIQCVIFGAVVAALAVIVLPSSDLSLQGRQSIQLFGTSLDPNYLAGVLLIPVLALVSALQGGGKWWLTRLLLLAIIFSAILLTGSRGGVLAVIIGVLIVLFGGSTRSSLSKVTQNRKLIVWAGIILVALFAFNSLPPEVQARFSLYSLTGGSNFGAYRLIVWEHGLRLFVVQPLLGIGIGAFATSMASVFRFIGSHNMFLLLLVETGIVGFCLFMAFLFSLLRQLLARGKSLGVGILIGTLAVAFFLDALTAKFLWNGLVFAVLLLNATDMTC